MNRKNSSPPLIRSRPLFSVKVFFIRVCIKIVNKEGIHLSVVVAAATTVLLAIVPALETTASPITLAVLSTILFFVI